MELINLNFNITKSLTIRLVGIIRIATLFFSLSCLSIDAQEYRLPPDITLLEQSVALTLDPNKVIFSGETNLSLNIKSPTNVVSYHSHNLVIESVVLTVNGKPSSLQIAKPDEYDIVRHILTDEISGKVSLKITYQGQFSEHSTGLFVQRKNVESAYIHSQFQPMEARTVFPSFDDPSKKAEFQFTLTIPAHLDALHNTHPESSKVDGDKKVIQFTKTEKMYSDVLALAVGEFDENVLQKTALNSTIYAPKGLVYSINDDMSALINNSVNYISDYLKYPLSYDKLDFFISPSGGAAMENVGLITLNPSELPPNNPSSSDLCEFRKLIAHEIAHMWFGNDITMQWYNEYWMNESFSEMFAAKVVQAHYPETAQCTYTPQSEAFADDNDNQTTLRYFVKHKGENESIGQLVYTKGFSVLQMLEQATGEPGFKKRIRLYAQDLKGGNTSLEQFTHYFSEFVYVSNMFDSFLNQSAYPLITIYKKENALYLKQENYFDDVKHWTVPLSLKIWDGKSVSNQTVILNSEEMRLDGVTGDASVFIGANGVGYFRHIDESGNNPFPINVLNDAERLSFMENNEGLAKSGRIDYMKYVDTLIHTLNTLPRDSIESEQALYSLIYSFVEFVPEDLRLDYANFLTSQLPKDIQWNDILDQDNGGFWIEFYGVYLDNEAVITLAKKQLNENKLQDAKHRLEILRVLAANATDSEYKALLDLFFKGDTSYKESVLDALGYTNKKHQVEQFYEFLLSDATKELTIDYRFQYPSFQPALSDFVAQYFVKNKDRILKRIPAADAQWFVYNVITACSEKEATSVKTTFSGWKNIDGLTEKLTTVLSNINECAAEAKNKLASIHERISTINTKQ